jgi:hypothetical protein
MIAVLVLGALAMPIAPAAEPAPLVRREKLEGRLVIPDEIAPAIVPYMTCQLLAHGVRIGPPGAAQAIPTAEQRQADCSGARQEAARRAERLLEQRGRGNAAERQAAVERVLASADAFVAQTAPPASGPQATAQDTVPIATTQVVRRLSFPPEIDAPMSRYGNCIAASSLAPGGDCTGSRRSAAAEADRSLRASTGLSARSRKELIEANLQNVEAFMHGLPVPHPDADHLPRAR